jgi:hypothetical protein
MPARLPVHAEPAAPTAHPAMGATEAAALPQSMCLLLVLATKFVPLIMAPAPPGATVVAPGPLMQGQRL